MTIQITGVLRDPIGQPLSNAIIRITALETKSVLAMISSKIELGVNATYAFILENGKYQIEILQSNEYHKIAYVDVTSLSITEITLEELIDLDGYCMLEAQECAS
jgi:hypothetical protein